MEYRLEQNDSFVRDIEEIYAYLESEAGGQVATDWLRVLVGAVETLRSFPRRCPMVLEVNTPWPELRYLLVGRGVSTYRIYFNVSDEGVRVIRVVHCSRNLALALAELAEIDRKETE